jgi:hypothetical protein
MADGINENGSTNPDEAGSASCNSLGLCGQDWAGNSFSTVYTNHNLCNVEEIHL